jgi:hypothetical protein
MKKKSGHLKRNKKIALDCYLRFMSGQTEEEIGLIYGWKIQIVEGGRRRCITAWRHIKDGEKDWEKVRISGAKAFGIEYKPLVRIRRCKNSLKNKKST